MGNLSALLAVIQLRRPTTRRALALLRELLEAQGRPDLHERALSIFGSAAMSQAEVQALLDQCLRAFDRAVEVFRTPIPFSFALRPHLRPYHYEGSLEMIEEGHHREAMFWISCLDTPFLVLQNDAPDAEKHAFATQLHAMYTALGYTSNRVWTERVQAAERLTRKVYPIADALAALHPE